MGNMHLTMDEISDMRRAVFDPKNEIIIIGVTRNGESRLLVHGGSRPQVHQLMEMLAYEKEQIIIKCEGCGKQISFMEYESHGGVCDACTGV